MSIGLSHHRSERPFWQQRLLRNHWSCAALSQAGFRLMFRQAREAFPLLCQGQLFLKYGIHHMERLWRGTCSTVVSCRPFLFFHGFKQLSCRPLEFGDSPGYTLVWQTRALPWAR